jgi:DNA (cytosine-5)-methyltransferase 1
MKKRTLRFIDLFCGIGGFHYAVERAASLLDFEAECVLASDIDKAVCESYETNFGIKPIGDITKCEAKTVPAHDLLLAGFPCQAFSIIGDRRGFEDTRGTLFFDIARVLDEKQPRGFVLENVKQLRGHDGGKTLSVILGTLRALGYEVDYKVLNALDFGLPQKRERVFIVGWKGVLKFDWHFENIPMQPLSEILETNADKTFYASAHIRQRRKQRVKLGNGRDSRPTIWHENKSGNISVYEYSCALRAGASYNYLLVNGERRLTPREMLRLQGFPEEFQITHSYTAMRRFLGNSLPIPVANAVVSRLLESNQADFDGTQPPKTSTSNQNASVVSLK